MSRGALVTRARAWLAHPWIVPVLVYAALSLFFVTPYWTDKPSTVVSLVESMDRHPSLLSHDVPCVHPDGSPGLKALWAEEPPTYHFLSWLVKLAGFRKLYVKLVPLACAVAWAMGIGALFGLAGLMTARPSRKLSMFLLFLPMIAIHATRTLPDLLAVALLTWAFVLLLKERWIWAWALLCLAVTTKALAVFGAMAFLGGWVLWGRSWNFKRRLAIGAFMGTSVIPMVAWLAYLHYAQVDNPFFGAEAVDLSRHTGGTALADAFSLRYWSRYFNWMAVQGASVPVFAAAIVGLWRVGRGFKRTKELERILFLYALCSPLYWLAVRGPQFTAPWYSFPFLAPFAILGIREILRLKPALQTAALVFAIAFSASRMGLSANVGRNVAVGLESRPIGLWCAPQGFGPGDK